MATAGNHDLVADEKEFEKRVKPHTFRSLDFCYDEAKASLAVQRQDIQYLGTKAASLLGFEGILVGALFAFWHAFSKDSSHLVSAFVMLSVVLLAISASFCLWAFRIRAYKGAPSPRILRERYITWSMANAKYKSLSAVLNARRQNNELIKQMSFRLNVGLILLTAAVLTLIVSFILLVLRR